MRTIRLYNAQGKWLTMVMLGLVLLLMSACDTTNNTTNTQSATPPALVPVNAFGSAANHVHSLLAFPNHVLLLATHYGLFRSENDGATWKEVASGPGQPMQGLMTYSLNYSPLNPQRLYVLTQIAVVPHPGILGLYTSADQGRTWKLAIPTASVASSIFMEAPGNDTPNEVYIYIPDLGALGLRVSLDNGQHFSSTGTLPFGSISGVLPLPGAPGQLLAYGSSGIARSTDGGAHWQVLKSVDSPINEMTTPGPHRPIYASGDAGIFSSLDGGKTFTLVNSQASYASLTVSPEQPQILYGETASAIYRSSDGGHTWTALPHISGNLGKLAVDPGNALQVYLSLNYPTAVYYLGQNSTGWQSRTPQA